MQSDIRTVCVRVCVFSLLRALQSSEASATTTTSTSTPSTPASVCGTACSSSSEAYSTSACWWNSSNGEYTRRRSHANICHRDRSQTEVPRSLINVTERADARSPIREDASVMTSCFQPRVLCLFDARSRYLGNRLALDGLLRLLPE